MWAVEHYRCYVYGTKFVVFTDHKPLLGIHKIRNPTSRLLRLYLKLSEYEITIEFRPGKFNQVADALSRMPLISINVITRSQKNRIEKDIVHKNNTQLTNTITSEISEQNESVLHNNTKTTPKRLTTVIEEEFENIECNEIFDGESIKSFYKNRNSETLQSEAERYKILREFHDSYIGGHQGIDKTIERIKRYYNWPNMREDVENYIKNCEICQKSKPSRRTYMEMQLVDVAKYPFFRLFLDVVGPLDVSLTGYKYILSIMDDLSRYFNVYPMENQDAATLCRVFFQNILSHHKTPKIIVTDNGSNFISKEFSKLCKFFGIRKIHASAYHPQSNGALERAHRSLGQYLRIFAHENPQNWDSLLPYVSYVHNNSVNRSTKLAPNDIVFGYISDFPAKVKTKPQPQYNFDCEFSNIYHSLHSVWEWARQNQQQAKEISKSYYDRNMRSAFFVPGDKVFVRNESRKGKFSFLWNGPYEVINQSGPVTTLVKIKQKQVKIHNNRLKICYQRSNVAKKN